MASPRMNRVLRPKNLNLESLPATTRLRPPQATGETSHPRRAVVRPRPSVVNSKNTKCGGADQVQPQVLELQRFPRSKTFSPAELPRVRRSSRLQGARFGPQIGEDFVGDRPTDRSEFEPNSPGSGPSRRGAHAGAWYAHGVARKRQDTAVISQLLDAQRAHVPGEPAARTRKR